MEVLVGDLLINYQVEGRGPPMILVHGGGVDLETWEDLVPLLRDHFTMFRADLRGLGRSRGPAEHHLSANDWVLDLKGFMDALGIEKAPIIGWALGGCIAATFAATYPDRAQWIAMLGAPGPIAKVKRSGIHAREELVRSGATPEEIIEKTFEFTRASFSPTVLAASPHAADRLKAALKRNVPTHYAEIMSAFSAAISSTSVLERIRCPVLILVGEHDLRTPVEMSVEISKYTERSYMKVLKDCGHFYPYEQPAVCARFIEEFARFAA